MTPEQIQAIHDKLDELLVEARLARNEVRRHGEAIADHEARIAELEDNRRPSNGVGHGGV